MKPENAKKTKQVKGKTSMKVPNLYFVQPKGKRKEATLEKERVEIASKIVKKSGACKILDKYSQANTNLNGLALFALNIDRMSEADIVITTNNWVHSSLCRAEVAVAKEFGLKIMDVSELDHKCKCGDKCGCKH